MSAPSIARFLRIRSASSPHFSHDSSKLAFISDLSGIPQAYAVSILEPSVPEPLTPYGQRVESLRFSPKQELLAYSSDLDGSERFQIRLLEYENLFTRDFAVYEGAIHHLGEWSPDGSLIAYSCNKRDAAIFDVYVKSLDGVERLAYESDGNVHPVAWSPDGRFLVLEYVHASFDTDLFILDTVKGSAKKITEHSGDAIFTSSSYSPEGDGIYLATNVGREFSALAYMRISDASLKFLDKLDWDVEEVAVSPDGGHVAYTVNVDGYTELRLFKTENGKVRRLAIPRGFAYSIKFSPDSRLIAFTLEAPRQAPNIYLLDLRREETLSLTDMPTAGIGKNELSEPILVKYRSFDGLELPSWLYLPSDAKQDGKNPAIVWAHGGPESQVRFSFMPVIQFFVLRGFVVMVPNFRGSSGYGKTFSHLDDVDKRMDAVRDVIEAAKWLWTNGWADQKRIGITGGSYGGFMVLACLTHFPDIFAAGVERVGIFNFLTFLKKTGPWRRKHRAAEYGDPERDCDFLRSISPATHIHKLKAPLLAAHGKNDPRVPVYETEQLIEMARQKGATIEYMLFEDEGHGIVRLENKIKFYTKAAEFFEEHLKGS